MIIFRANSRQANCLSDDAITTGSAGIEVRFSCSDEWDGLARVAIFKGSGEQVDMLITDDVCTVPQKVLTKSGSQLRIGLYGTDGSGDLMIPTVWADAGRILSGAAPSDLDPTQEEQTLLDQMIAALQRDASSAAASAGIAADAAAEAQKQARSSESWAVGGTGSREGEDQNNSKFWAMVAQQGAEHSGYAIFDVNDQDGQMYVTITDPLAQDVSFLVNETTGELEVTING